VVAGRSRRPSRGETPAASPGAGGLGPKTGCHGSGRRSVRPGTAAVSRTRWTTSCASWTRAEPAVRPHTVRRRPKARASIDDAGGSGGPTASATASAHGLPRPARPLVVEGSCPFEPGLCRHRGWARPTAPTPTTAPLTPGAGLCEPSTSAAFPRERVVDGWRVDPGRPGGGTPGHLAVVSTGRLDAASGMDPSATRGRSGPTLLPAAAGSASASTRHVLGGRAHTPDEAGVWGDDQGWSAPGRCRRAAHGIRAR
jgi:hypothetical protein